MKLGESVRYRTFYYNQLFENAICHGADLCESKGKIKIEYIYGEEFLEFHVYNNGPKVVGEELERILNTPGKGYGIYNIRERIRMYYDEKSVACTVQLRMRGWFVSPLKSEKR